jgi:hypothetical protein
MANRNFLEAIVQAAVSAGYSGWFTTAAVL